MWFQNRRQRDRNLARAAENWTGSSSSGATKGGRGRPASEAAAAASEADEEMLPPLPSVDRLNAPPSEEGMDELGRSVSPAPSNIETGFRHAGSSASSPPMSPTSHDNNDDGSGPPPSHIKSGGAHPRLNPTSEGRGGGGERPTGLDARAAAALPNVAAYLQHMERHQHAFAMGSSPSQGPPPLPPHHMPTAEQQQHAWRGNNPYQNPPANAMAYPQSGLPWPNMTDPGQLTSLPPPAAPRVPTAESPAPTDDKGSLAASDAAARSSVAEGAAGHLPYARAMPMPPGQPGPNPMSACSAAALIGRSPAAQSLLETAALNPAALPGALSTQGVVHPNHPNAPTDAASLSMLYAALSSHFAQVAQAWVPGSGPPPNAAQASLPQQPPIMPNNGAMPASFNGGSPAANLPSWWHQRHSMAPTAPPGYRNPYGPSPTDRQLPPGQPSMPGTQQAGSSFSALGMLSDGLKRRAEPALRGGNIMSSGAGHHMTDVAPFSAGRAPYTSSPYGGPLFSTPSGVPYDPNAGNVRLQPVACTVDQPRESKLPRRSAPSVVGATQMGADGQVSLVQNLAAACGANGEDGMSHESVPRQMSDEEVFSMFAEELKEMGAMEERVEPPSLGVGLPMEPQMLKQDAMEPSGVEAMA